MIKIKTDKKKVSYALDVDDEIKQEQEKGLNKREQLEAILFQFINLYEHWSEDRQVTAKHHADLAKLVKGFAEMVSDFDHFQTEVKETIKEQVYAEAKNMAEYMGKKLHERVEKEMAGSIGKFEGATQRAREALADVGGEFSLMSIKMIAAIVISSALACSLAVGFFMH